MIHFNKIKLALVITIGFIPLIVSGQNFSIFGWSQLSTTPAIAQSYQYKVYEGTTATIITGVTCVANGVDAVCTAPIPANLKTVGTHTLTLTAAFTNGSAESGKSNPLSLTIQALPGVPSNFTAQ